MCGYCTVHIYTAHCTYCTVHVHTSQYMYILQSTCTYCTVHVHTAQYMYILHSTCTYCTVHVHTSQYMYILHSTYILHILYSTCSCTPFPSRYQELSVSSDNIYIPRTCTSISELGSYQLPYGEFDTVGVVMSVTSSSPSGREDRSVGGAGGTLNIPIM